MNNDINPNDALDSLQWLIGIARENEPVGGYEQLDRNRLHTASQLKDALQREARNG